MSPIVKEPSKEQIDLPAGFILRSPTMDDVPGVVAVMNANWQKFQGTEPFTAEEVSGDWSEPGFDLATEARVITTTAGQIVAHVDLVCRTPFVRALVWARTHPDYYGLGFGTGLTRWAEAYAQEKMRAAPDDARLTIECSNLAQDHAAANLLTGLGYPHSRSFYSMKIEMAAPPPAPVWPAGITVRPMLAGEEATVFRAKDDSFVDHWGHIEMPFDEAFALWSHGVASNPRHDPSTYFLALDGDEIAGVALCVPQDDEFPDMAWIDSLGVRRPWRRQGLALALLHHSFGEFYRRGIKQVGLGVDASSLTGAVRLYEKAGMQTFRQFNVYEKEIRPGRDLATRAVTPTE